MRHLSVRAGAVTLALVIGGAVAAALSWALRTQSYNVWGAIIVVPLLTALNLLLISRVARGSREKWLGSLLVLALAAKILGTLVRYAVAYVVYEGAADAERYNLYAAAHYQLWRQGSIQWEVAGARGTQYMEFITTVIYTVIGPSPLAAFVVFASFAFWGQYLLYRAFCVALPWANARRYALLVLLLPSMLYWPSSIGKEAWLMLFVGVTALGAAKLFAHRSGAVVLLAVGAAGTGIIRPHIALLLFAGLAVAQLFRPTGERSTDILSKLGGLLVVGAVTVVLTTQSAAMLGIDDLSWQAISESVDFRQEQTAQGGSSFSPVPVTSVIGIPIAVITILFRPLPWEAQNAQLLLQSIEGLVLLAITVRAWPAIRRLPQVMRQHAYVVFAMTYSMAFVVAFSGFGNFGILARQRVLMLPFFFILLALTPANAPQSPARATKDVHHAPR
ncbi:hypothetical protein [Intrasporangium sp. DVR]|uniref:hypothetical protein n=1 Tax=Intrasporangium sp. DVR TaxID=3127867 RepID=UPI00313A5311